MSGTRDRERGFTLIELMVVVAILALLSATVVLTMADPRGRLPDDALRFAGRVRAAHDRAVLLARPVAVEISPSGYAFAERRDGTWVPLRERPFEPRRWGHDARAVASGAGPLRLWFDPTGRADRDAAFLLLRDRERLSVRVGLDGRVTTGG